MPSKSKSCSNLAISLLLTFTAFSQMHNLTKIKIFRILLCITYPFAVILVYPFALMKRKKTSALFFFFDRYVLGGAQRVHLDILESVRDISKQVYFTRVSANNIFRQEFYALPNATVKDIHFWCDNLLFRLFSVHYYAFYINRHKKAHILSSNSTFFYDMLPFLKNGIIKTELLHNFTLGKNGMEFFGLANHKYLNHRLTVDNATLNNIKAQYQLYKIEAKYFERLMCIEPGVIISDAVHKDFNGDIHILYAGRGGQQKRPHLLDAIAQQCIERKLPVTFHFAGDVIDELSSFVQEHSVLHGQVRNPDDMYAIYASCHVILMTSAYEGFPMLIKEGMANGCIPVVTALEGNRSHLKNGSNALLMFEPKDETGVINQGVMLIENLVANRALLQTLSHNAYNYAGSHFSKQAFMYEYRRLLTQ